MPPHASLLKQPDRAAMIPWPAELGPRFLLMIDTEEEFDWWGPFDRAATAVSHARGMARFQSYISDAGVTPTWLCDHAIVDNDPAVEALGPWVEAGKAGVGAHLHPWINPPHEETVCLGNSYAGSLPRELERAKLIVLRDRIAQRFGRAPRVYRAGRYGLGPNSAALLEETGFTVDSSVRPGFDYRPFLGPDFMTMPLMPFRAGPGGRIIELPLSTAWLGGAGRLGGRLYPLAMRSKPFAGVLARSRLLSRVPLTPEGVSAASCIAAIDTLLDQGVMLLNFSFHSPTLEPGNTVYCRSAHDLDDFYRWWDSILAHLDKRGVKPVAVDDLATSLDRALPIEVALG